MRAPAESTGPPAAITRVKDDEVRSPPRLRCGDFMTEFVRFNAMRKTG